MASRLIRLEGTLIEISTPGDRPREISSGTADRVATSMSEIDLVVFDASAPFISAVRRMRANLPDADACGSVKGAELQFGLGLDAEGGIYITQANEKANLLAKLSLKQGRLQIPPHENKRRARTGSIASHISRTMCISSLLG